MTNLHAHNLQSWLSNHEDDLSPEEIDSVEATISLMERIGE